jgi:hypothetical protein
VTAGDSGLGPTPRPRPDLGPDLADLAGRLRGAGVGVDVARIGLALSAIAELGPVRPDTLYWGSRLTLCTSRADLVVFDAVFAAWLAGRRTSESAVPGRAGDAAGPPSAFDAPAGEPSVGELLRDGAPVAVGSDDDPTALGPSSPTGTAAGEEAGDEAGAGSRSADGTATRGVRAVPTEAPAHRDLRTLTDAERAEIDEMITVLAATRPLRPSRRWRPGGRRRLDPAGTLRAMLRDGGEPAHPRYRRRRDRPRRLTLLVDVSESMTGYREALLRFAHAALLAAPATTEVFTLGTRCTRVTRALAVRDPQRAVAALAAAEPHQGGGTRLGWCLREFLRTCGGDRRVRAATVVIASDGHDSGPSALLARQVERLSRLAYRLIWVNPQQGWPGFRPMAPGLVASLRYVDHALPGHSFAALRDLAEVVRR